MTTKNPIEKAAATATEVLSTVAGTSTSTGKEKKSLREVFEKELKGMYDAEKQLLKALPEIAKATYNEDLQEAIMDHVEQTKKHVERLEKIFVRLRIDKDAEKCMAMEGLIEEGKKIIQEFEQSPARDAALIISAQKIEHYEIASYGSLSELADVLGFHQAADILDRTLEEEEMTDELLTEIAEEINDEAFEMEEGEDKE